MLLPLVQICLAGEKHLMLVVLLLVLVVMLVVVVVLLLVLVQIRQTIRRLVGARHLLLGARAAADHCRRLPPPQYLWRSRRAGMLYGLSLGRLGRVHRRVGRGALLTQTTTAGQCGE